MIKCKFCQERIYPDSDGMMSHVCEGKVIVPVEPTVEMCNGGNVALTKGYQQGLIQSSDIYMAMLSTIGETP